MYKFMNIRPMGAELFHADGQTDTTKLIVAIRKFLKASNNGSLFAADPSSFNFPTVHLNSPLSFTQRIYSLPAFRFPFHPRLR